MITRVDFIKTIDLLKDYDRRADDFATLGIDVWSSSESLYGRVYDTIVNLLSEGMNINDWDIVNYWIFELTYGTESARLLKEDDWLYEVGEDAGKLYDEILKRKESINASTM